jgi:hypothetical protein
VRCSAAPQRRLDYFLKRLTLYFFWIIWRRAVLLLRAAVGTRPQNFVHPAGEMEMMEMRRKTVSRTVKVARSVGGMEFIKNAVFFK